jgi:hypothetical protein
VRSDLFVGDKNSANKMIEVLVHHRVLELDHDVFKFEKT